MTQLHELASLVRSKNAGPFDLTFDILFNQEDAYQRCRASDAFTVENLAGILGVQQSDIRIFLADTARAIKISIPRPVSQGDIGDSDGHGGQQYAALLSIPISD